MTSSDSDFVPVSMEYLFLDKEDSELTIADKEFLNSTNLVWTRNTVRDISVRNAIYEQTDNFDSENAPNL